MKEFRPIATNRFLTSFVAFCFLFSTTIPLTGCGGGGVSTAEEHGTSSTGPVDTPPMLVVPDDYRPFGTLVGGAFSALSTTEKVAMALGVEEDAIVSFSFNAFSGTNDLGDSEEAWNVAPDHVLLTTGLGEDRGWGDTDLADDGEPDSSYFTVELNVPPTVGPTMTRRTLLSSRPGSARPSRRKPPGPTTTPSLSSRFSPHFTVSANSPQGRGRPLPGPWMSGTSQR